MRDFDENPTIEGLTHGRNWAFKMLQRERQRSASFKKLADERGERIEELENELARIKARIRAAILIDDV